MPNELNPKDLASKIIEFYGYLMTGDERPRLPASLVDQLVSQYAGALIFSMAPVEPGLEER